MKTTSVTCYGLVGFDWTRLTAVILESGAAAFRRADGTNTVIDVLPTLFRTSGDIVRSAALLGHKVNMAAVPKVGLENHTWKPSYDLKGIVDHMGGKPELVALLQATYAEDQDEVDQAA